MKHLKTFLVFYLLIFTNFQYCLDIRSILNTERIKKSKKNKINLLSNLQCKGDQWLEKLEIKDIISKTNKIIKKKNDKEDILIDEELGEMRLTRMRILQTNKFYLGGDDVKDEDRPAAFAVCVKSCPKSKEKICTEDKQKKEFDRAFFFYFEKCISANKMRITYIGQDKNCRDAVSTSPPWELAGFQTVQLDLLNIKFNNDEVKKNFEDIINEAKAGIQKDQSMEFLQEVFGGILSAIVEKLIEELKWATAHFVLTVLDFTPLVVFSGPIHLIVGASQLVKSTYDLFSKMKKSIEVVAKFLKGLPFQERLQKSKIKKGESTENKIRKVIETGSKVSQDMSLQSIKDGVDDLDNTFFPPISKRSFRGLVQALNCALKKETEQTIPAMRNLMKGIYNEIVLDKTDSETFLSPEIQSKYSEYYNSCK